MSIVRGKEKDVICRATSIPRYTVGQLFSLTVNNPLLSNKKTKVYLRVPVFQKDIDGMKNRLKAGRRLPLN